MFQRPTYELASSTYKKSNSVGIWFRMVRKVLGCHGAMAHGMLGSRVLISAADMLCMVYVIDIKGQPCKVKYNAEHATPGWLPEWLKTRCKQYSTKSTSSK